MLITILLTSCVILRLMFILQLVMEYCIGSASNLLEGWFVIPLDRTNLCLFF